MWNGRNSGEQLLHARVQESVQHNIEGVRLENILLVLAELQVPIKLFVLRPKQSVDGALGSQAEWALANVRSYPAVALKLRPISFGRPPPITLTISKDPSQPSTLHHGIHAPDHLVRIVRAGEQGRNLKRGEAMR